MPLENGRADERVSRGQASERPPPAPRHNGSSRTSERGGQGDCVKEGGGAEGECESVHWGCYYATSLDIEVDPQRCCFGSRKSDFALQAVVECRALEPECFRVVGLR